MTNNTAKIRAALDLYDRLDDSYTGWAGVFESAYDALAELEKAATQFVAGEVDDAMCERICESFLLAITRRSKPESSRVLIAAVRSELGPALGLVEIREPTPEECERICMCYLGLDSPPSFGAKLGREVFDAVSAVMWPKESGK